MTFTLDSLLPVPANIDEYFEIVMTYFVKGSGDCPGAPICIASELPDVQEERRTYIDDDAEPVSVWDKENRRVVIKESFVKACYEDKIGKTWDLAVQHKTGDLAHAIRHPILWDCMFGTPGISIVF
jgi:hypothetical protein